MDEVQPKFRMFSLGISEFEVYFTELQTSIGIACEQWCIDHQHTDENDDRLPEAWLILGSKG
jgi:hypothetical protein